MVLVRGRRTPQAQQGIEARTCPQCGHPVGTTATSRTARAWRRIHPVTECFHAEHEYSVLRDGWCGCRAEAHRR